MLSTTESSLAHPKLILKPHVFVMDKQMTSVVFPEIVNLLCPFARKHLVSKVSVVCQAPWKKPGNSIKKARVLCGGCLGLMDYSCWVLKGIQRARVAWWAGLGAFFLFSFWLWIFPACFWCVRVCMSVSTCGSTCTSEVTQGKCGCLSQSVATSYVEEGSPSWARVTNLTNTFIPRFFCVCLPS